MRLSISKILATTLILSSVVTSAVFASIESSTTSELLQSPVSSVSSDPTKTSIQEASAKNLVDLGVLNGYPDGSLGLENKIKRSEFIALVIRLMGYDQSTDAAGVSMDFKDIDKKNWAYDSFKIALKHNLITGYPDKTLKPENNVTYVESLTILIRALNYEKTLTGKWPDNIINMANNLKLTDNISIPNDTQVTRGEISILLYNSLTININPEQ